MRWGRFWIALIVITAAITGTMIYVQHRQEQRLMQTEKSIYCMMYQSEHVKECMEDKLK